MVKLSRRKTILGMGLLAGGSGAAFSSASFTNSVDAGADMRIVTEDDLLIEPGANFRDDSDDYDSTLDPTSGKFAGSDNNDFFDSDSPSGGSNEPTGGDISFSDLPAAYVSNDTNGDLTIKVAVELGETATFEDLLQVTNNTSSSVDIGIYFQAFGVDTTGDISKKGGDVDEENVMEAYTFHKDSSSGSQISTDASDYDSPGSQSVPSSMTVSSASTEQIALKVDTTSSVDITGTDIESQIETARNTSSGNPFTGIEDTIQLVDTLEIGTDPDTTS